MSMHLQFSFRKVSKNYTANNIMARVAIINEKA
jgi:hypothetical protein